MSNISRKIMKNKLRACEHCGKVCFEYIGLACIYLGGTVDPEKHKLMRIKTADNKCR